MRSDLDRLALAMAHYLDPQETPPSYCYVGEQAAKALSLANWGPTIVLKRGWETRDGDESPLELPAGVGPRVVVYVPIEFLGRWQQFPDALPRLLAERQQLVIVLFHRALRAHAIEGFRWILSALVGALPAPTFALALEFVPDGGPRHVGFWLRAPRRLAGTLLGAFRWALAYDETVGIKTDPQRFSALVISISRPSANAEIRQRDGATDMA